MEAANWPPEAVAQLRGREPPKWGARSSCRPCANQHLSPRWQSPSSLKYMHSSVLYTGRTWRGTQAGTASAGGAAGCVAGAGAASSSSGSSASAGVGSNSSQVPAGGGRHAGRAQPA